MSTSFNYAEMIVLHTVPSILTFKTGAGLFPLQKQDRSCTAPWFLQIQEHLKIASHHVTTNTRSGCQEFWWRARDDEVSSVDSSVRREKVSFMLRKIPFAFKIVFSVRSVSNLDTCRDSDPVELQNAYQYLIILSNFNVS